MQIDERTLILPHAVDSIQLDSLSLVPGSLRILMKGQEVATSVYKYDYNTQYLHLKRDILAENEPLNIYYRVLPFSFGITHAHKSLSLFDSTAFFKDIKSQNQTSFKSREELFETPRLQKSGSISRGISIGNRQNVFLNSSLNLQIEGALSDDLRIRASITDQNIPIQPEGNTQQLQDFDNVYLELYNDELSLLAGDVILQQDGNSWQGNNRMASDPSSIGVSSQISSSTSPYFLRYRRNVQGGVIRTNHSYAEQVKAETKVGFALAKGKFASVTLNIQEGVQGPYQINSPENQNSGNSANNPLEAYFIIANTEKVYLDGRLLERGYDKDYTINYNLSEIIFTSRVMLTRFSRVYIDFEYADRSYSRSIITASHRQDFKQISFYTHYYREKDNPHQALGFTLSDEEKLLLQEAGDYLENAVVPAVDSAVHFQQQPQYQTNRNADVPGVGNLYQVFYDRKDTVINEVTFQVYEFVGKAGDFKVDFSYVGEGKGNYQISGSAVNSKVYEWIAPLNGTPRGSYEPVRLLATPRNQHMIVIGMEGNVSDKDQITAEFAFTKNDLNVLSPRDAHDDQGLGIFVQYKGKDRKFFKSAYQWGSHMSYEYRQKYFKEVDPYRNIEFERDWTLQIYNPQDSSNLYDDHILSSKIYLKKDALNHFGYQWVGRQKETAPSGVTLEEIALAGIQHRATASKSLGKIQLSGQAFFLQSRHFDTQARWQRWSIDTHYRGKNIRPGYTYREDKNWQSSANTDSVSYSSMNYEEHLFYVRSADSLQGNFQLDYSIRKDFMPYEGELLQSDLAQTLTATADLPIFSNHQLNVQLAYRQLAIKNDSIFSYLDGINSEIQANTLMGQLNWSGTFAKGAISSDMHYSLANGREPKREFVYIQVPVGEGTYTWRDDNGNGIEEIYEFYEALYFDERNYVRVFVPTTDFLLAYTNTFDYQLNIQPPNEWLEKKGIRNWLGRFSNITAWNINKRLTDEHLVQRLLPWMKTEDEYLLSTRESLRSTLFFNRRQTSHGAEAGIRNLRRKQLLNGGFEERKHMSYLLGIRLNPNRHWGIRAQGEKGEEIQILEIGPQGGRNFHIDYYKLWPELSWQPAMHTRVSAKYTYAYKQNQTIRENNLGKEFSEQHILGLEFRANKLMKHSVNAIVEYIDILYDGAENTPIAYEMLDGMSAGGNMRWTLNWQQQIFEGLQLVLNYYGRKSIDRPTIHSGNVMVRALF
ncbi:hypothetical protein [Catalinimonas niigatensis]|uniref:hypothetical protein n=1 Tax=Catalinimonas niigatensis TaxID=1397264 RepID=UPI0026655C38|nr:hypothetical protein [Catalinimonas niigatensis]WPP51501.1 hypothetical protein PZB72_03745 [Catalinimonas niigatensis]